MAAGFGFTSTQRIRRAVDFKLLTKSGLKAQDPFFTVLGLSSRQAKGRLGVTVSRRVSPHAVTRNRIKRQIRESFRHHQEALSGLDVVVIARAAATSVAGTALQESLQQHWKNIQKQCRRFSSP